MAELLGVGSKFQRETGTPGTYTDIAQVVGITPPQAAVDVVEVEDLDPPEAVKKKLPGLIDAGEVTVTLNFDPSDTGHSTLESDFWERSTHKYRIVLPDDNGWTFEAFISDFSPSDVAAGEPVQAEVTFTLSGKPSFGAIT